MGEIDRTKMNTKFRGATFQTTRIKITFAMEPILRKLVDKGLVRYKDGKFYPISYKAALQYDIPNIVNYISSVFRGLSNYYGFAHNWYDAKTLCNYFGLYCTAMTIAQKTKSKVSKVFKKYGLNLQITNMHNKVIAKFGSLTNADFEHNIKNYKPANSCATNVEHLLFANLRIAKKQMQKVAICGPK